MSAKIAIATEEIRKMSPQTAPSSSSTLAGGPGSNKISSLGAERLYQVDPISDPRWHDLVVRSAEGSLFHSPEWLMALQQTYGYKPLVFTTTGPGNPLTSGLIFCRVDSWLTGRRLVSVPFSDYCDFLCTSDEDLEILLRGVQEYARNERLRYVEVRPTNSPSVMNRSFRPLVTYTLHRLDLRPELGALFANLHKDSIQRKIRRAERDGVEYEEGSTERLLDIFYKMLIITRRRHRVPPQPRLWFANLMKYFGPNLKIRVSLKAGLPIAGMLTIRHKDTLYYKYGGSDVRFNRLGSMHLLYWRAIQDGKSLGLNTFDLGRTDADQTGLITFKKRWGSTVSQITYSRMPSSKSVSHVFEPSGRSWQALLTRNVFALAPTRLLPALGALLYKHIG
jgi:CelD/BcsL family acetyltransferase involved in cellulose biosynthesis